MSTKTTIKRIAAVAAVALTLGGFSAVSANAANTKLVVSLADGVTSGSAGLATANGVAGPANYVQVTVKAPTGWTTAKDGIVAISGGTISSVSGTGYTANTLGTQVSFLASASVDGVITVPTPVTGTITLNLYTGTGGIYGTTAAETVTITVGTVASSGAYSAAKTTIYAAAGDTITVNAASQALVDATPIVAAKTAGAAAGAVPVASFAVNYLDALGAAIADTITATVAGAGVIDGVAKAASVAAGTASGTTRVENQYSDSVALDTSNGFAYFYLYANGISGVSTVTFRNGAGTVLGTKTVTFSDTNAATLTATVKKAYIVKSATTGSTDAAAIAAGSATYVFKVVAKDASGFVVSGAAITATAADTTKVSSLSCGNTGSTGVSYCSATTGSVYGATTVTFKSVTTATGAAISTTADVTVVSATAATLTITADDAATSGGVITYTITAKDANGYPVPDGTAVSTYVGTPVVVGGALVDYSGNANAVSALFDSAVVFAAGVAKDTVQAPFGATTIKATFTNTGTEAVADSNLVAALAGVETVVSTVVSSGDASAIQAAQDAAQEATDAANAAYDAANNAMDSADAATAAAQDAADNAAQALTAVVALSETVAKLVKQITAIAATLAKIQAKLKA